MKKIVIAFVLTLSLMLVGTAFCAAYNEAPELREKVDNGELPPVEERLPDNPAVVEPVDEIGSYGGELKKASAQRTMSLFRYGYDPLLRWDRQTEEILPNVATDWEFNEEGTEYTFYLRKGIKWSDGEPFTTDDIMFWYNEIIKNKQLTPAAPAWIKSGKELAEFEALDDYTLRITYPETKAGVINAMADASSGLIWAPAHYLKDFHSDYTDEDELEEKVEESGFDSWDQLFGQKNDDDLNPDLPVLRPWKLSKKDSQTSHAVRNPYYWKVDTEGNQLPYINAVNHETVEDKEVLTMKAVAGELDFNDGLFVTEKLQLLSSRKDEGNYEILQWGWSITGIGTLYLNQNHKDEHKRELMQNKKFRYALSHAINRDELNKFFTVGIGTPSQAAPPPDSQYYVEDFAKSHIEYDVEKANELLDEIGLTEKKDGYRVLPNGETLTLRIAPMTPGFGIDAGQYSELIKGYWKEIGVNANVKPMEQSLWLERVSAAEHDVAIYACAGGYFPISVFHFPISSYAYWAPLYGEWYATDGESGEEPPQDSGIRKLMDIHDELQVTVEQDERTSLMKEAMRVHGENLYHIGTLRPAFRAIYKSQDLGNVVESTMLDNPNGCPGNADPFQWYFK